MAPTPTQIVERLWTGDALDFLSDFIRIPNVSPFFDPEWEQDGHMTRAVDTAREWSEHRGLAGLETRVHHAAGLPALLVSVDGGGLSQGH